MATIGDIVFGKNNNDRIQKLYFCEEITKEEAQEVLEAIRLPEIKEVLSTLQNQIEKGMPELRYISPETGLINKYKTFLFSDWSYQSGFIQGFYRLIDKTFSGYRKAKTQPILEIIMEKE